MTVVIEDTHTRTHNEARAEGYTLTVEDVAAQIGKSVETVRRYIRTGRLPALRVEGKNTNEYRINADDLHAIDARTQSHTQAPAHAGDRTPMGVSVDIITALTLVEQTQRQVQEEIVGLRETMDRLTAALEENTRAHEKVDTQPAQPAAPPRRPRSLLGQIAAHIAERSG